MMSADGLYAALSRYDDSGRKDRYRSVCSRARSRPRHSGRAYSTDSRDGRRGGHCTPPVRKRRASVARDAIRSRGGQESRDRGRSSREAHRHRKSDNRGGSPGRSTDSAPRRRGYTVDVGFKESRRAKIHTSPRAHSECNASARRGHTVEVGCKEGKRAKARKSHRDPSDGREDPLTRTGLRGFLRFVSSDDGVAMRCPGAMLSEAYTLNTLT